MKKTRAQRAVVKGVHGSERNRFASQRAFLLLTSSLLPFSLLFSARLGSILGPLQALARLCDDRENQPFR